jgi:peptide deformylase
LECKGLEATIFQHEIDHINGVLFIDHVTEYTRGTKAPAGH